MGLRTRFQFHESDSLIESLLRVRRSADDLLLGGDGWHRDRLRPSDALDRIPELWIRQGWQLRCAHFRDMNGVGCALWPQEDSAENSLPENFDPKGSADSLSDPFDAIDGEPGAWSYLVSSLLRRELQEWGATGAYRRWIKHEPLGRRESDVVLELRTGRNIELPDDLRPEVVEDNSRVSVRFWTLRRDPSQRCIYEHRDIYRPLGFDHEASERLLYVVTEADALFDALGE